MPRDNDKNNDSSRGRRDRPSPGKGRSGAARGPDKKFAKRGFAGKSDGDKRPFAGKPDGEKSFGKKPYSGPGKPYAGKREGPAPRRDGDSPRPPRFNRDDRPRSDRPFADRPSTHARHRRTRQSETARPQHSLAKRTISPQPVNLTPPYSMRCTASY